MRTFCFREYIDLKRNQELLKELVIRRGIPVLDSIPSGLQRTRAILTGNLARSPPSNISSRLKYENNFLFCINRLISILE